MKPNETLVQLHGDQLGGIELIPHELIILVKHALLTQDIAVKFAEWCDDDSSNIAVNHKSRDEAFTYFLENVYNK